MKLTKSILKDLIREELYKSKLSRIVESWVLSEDGETIVNPETKRKIKLSTALSYEKDHPAYKAAVKFQNRDNDSRRKAVTGMRGGKDGVVSSSDKTNKVMSNILKPDGEINRDVIDKMSPKSKDKLAKLLRTRVDLVGKISDKVEATGQKISDSYYDSGANEIRGQRQEDGSVKFASGAKLSSDDYERYTDELYDFRNNEDNREYGNGVDAIFNAQWSLKNPKTPTIKLDTAKKIQADVDKIKPLRDKQRSLIPPNGLRNVRRLIDNLE